MLPRAMRALSDLFLATVASAVSFTAFADNVNGAWDSPESDNWPMNAIHLSLTPDGRVLSFGSNGDGTQTGYFIYDVWDPSTGLGGGHLTLPNVTQTDIFCSAAVIIPGSGDILIAGGDVGDGTEVEHLGNNRSTIYRASDASLTRGPDMNFGRWYASVTPLLNGEVYVQGGKGTDALPAGPEVRRQDGTFRRLDGVVTSSYAWYYPRNFLAPDGGIFGIDTGGKMFKVQTGGAGSITPKGQFDASFAGKESTVAPFAPYKVLQISANNSNAVVIDFSGQTPVVTQTASLSSRRAWASATVLPNGRVLVTGGSEVPDTLTGVNTQAEIWDPQTGNWSLGAPGARPRLYHSAALLLPDATVLVAGGGSAPTSPVTNMHAEIYFPPYLYDAEGGFAARPTIESAPDILQIGATVPIVAGASDVIQRVTLVRASGSTHGLNNTQHFVELAFAVEGGALNAQMPINPADAPPGYYLLFVINDAGVPSRARIVRINPQAGGGDPEPDPDPEPEPEPAGDLVPPTQPTGLALARSGGGIRVNWNASADNVGVVAYAIHRGPADVVGPEVARVAVRTWTDNTVVEGVRYAYTVRAYDAAGNASSAPPLKHLIPYQIPTTPGSFALKLTNKKPQLNFTRSTDNVGVAGYNVYRSTTGNMGSLHAQIGGPGWVDTGALKGKTYTYAVRARDAAGYLSNRTPLKTITSQ
jgi:hypothetical protein